MLLTRHRPQPNHTTDDRHDADSHLVKGAGLARGPALIIGSVLAVCGLALFFKVAGTPLSTAGFPDADVQGQRLLGFEANAWTAWLTTAAGVLVLFGAAQHLLAKVISLIVGVALTMGVVLAVIDGNDVLGLAAVNGLTALAWSVAALLLLANVLMPRRHHEVADTAPAPAPTPAHHRAVDTESAHDRALDADQQETRVQSAPVDADQQETRVQPAAPAPVDPAQQAAYGEPVADDEHPPAPRDHA